MSKRSALGKASELAKSAVSSAQRTLHSSYAKVEEGLELDEYDVEYEPDDPDMDSHFDTLNFSDSTKSKSRKRYYVICFGALLVILLITVVAISLTNREEAPLQDAELLSSSVSEVPFTLFKFAPSMSDEGVWWYDLEMQASALLANVRTTWSAPVGFAAKYPSNTEYSTFSGSDGDLSAGERGSVSVQIVLPNDVFATTSHVDTRVLWTSEDDTQQYAVFRLPVDLLPLLSQRAGDAKALVAGVDVKASGELAIAVFSKSSDSSDAGVVVTAPRTVEVVHTDSAQARSPLALSSGEMSNTTATLNPSNDVNNDFTISIDVLTPTGETLSSTRSVTISLSELSSFNTGKWAVVMVKADLTGWVTVKLSTPTTFAAPSAELEVSSLSTGVDIETEASRALVSFEDGIGTAHFRVEAGSEFGSTDIHLRLQVFAFHLNEAVVSPLLDTTISVEDIGGVSERESVTVVMESLFTGGVTFNFDFGSRVVTQASVSATTTTNLPVKLADGLNTAPLSLHGQYGSIDAFVDLPTETSSQESVVFQVLLIFEESGLEHHELFEVSVTAALLAPLVSVLSLGPTSEVGWLAVVFGWRVVQASNIRLLVDAGDLTVSFEGDASDMPVTPEDDTVTARFFVADVPSEAETVALTLSLEFDDANGVFQSAVFHKNVPAIELRPAREPKARGIVLESTTPQSNGWITFNFAGDLSFARAEVTVELDHGLEAEYTHRRYSEMTMTDGKASARVKPLVPALTNELTLEIEVTALLFSETDMLVGSVNDVVIVDLSQLGHELTSTFQFSTAKANSTGWVELSLLQENKVTNTEVRAYPAHSLPVQYVGEGNTFGSLTTPTDPSMGPAHPVTVKAYFHINVPKHLEAPTVHVRVAVTFQEGERSALSLFHISLPTSDFLE